MRPAVEGADVARLRAIASARLGLAIDDGKLALVADALVRRLESTRLSAAEYLDRLERVGPSPEEVGALAAELTVGETYFFRNADQHRAFVEVAVPERLAARAGRPLRILSAGCASGEEPYSLAILLAESVAAPPPGADILGVDVSPVALSRARRAAYSSWSLRETSDERRRRWFRAQAGELVLDRGVVDAVRFREGNLVVDDPELWAPRTWDVVFCRNVLMYLVPEVARSIVARIARALVPGGTLFLGHAETLRGLSCEFHLRHSHGTFYYQVRTDGERVRGGFPRPASAVPTAPPPSGSPLDGAESWVEAIQVASDRIRDLVRTPAAVAPAPSGSRPGGRSPADLTLAIELLRAERFDEAIQRVEALGTESDADPEVLLLRAALLTHAGRLEAAELACERLLAVDDLDAGAHYLLALCREGRGDRKGAAEHDQVAIYLDPTFAMPRLHQGLAARRHGDRETAQRELATALVLLEREDASRLLLFGGGFPREALAALCRAELAAAGGTA